jgi:hypothetical protein
VRHRVFSTCCLPARVTVAILGSKPHPPQQDSIAAPGVCCHVLRHVAYSFLLNLDWVVVFCCRAVSLTQNLPPQRELQSLPPAHAIQTTSISEDFV